MKKLTLLVAFSMLLQFTFAGGLLTNYNQSAQYIRMMSRNASLDIDGIFYNPAGLIKLEDGWHFAFYSQTIFQTREVTTSYPLLNNDYYKGETTVPIFPDFYMAYKKDKWAFSLGIGPAGGGGTAEFPNGIPSLEIPFSRLVPGLAGLSQIDDSYEVTGYDLDMSLEASSTFWGIQLGATYAISDQFSVFGGARLMPAINTYDGYIRNIQLEVGGQKVNASTWLTGASGQVSTFAGMASAGSDVAYGAAESMQPIIDGGGSGYTLAQLEGAGFIGAADKAQLEGGLLQLGIPQAQIDAMNAGQIQGTYNTAGDQLLATATTLTGTAETLSSRAEDVADKKVKVKQKGMGVTPIIGFNFSPNDDWNIAMKYEFKTKLTLENDTEVDDMGLFPDGVESVNDVPAIFTAGIGYRGLDWLEAQLSYNMYFDKDVDYGYNIRYLLDEEQVHRDIDGNYWELGLGLQFNLSDKFALSVGGLRSKNGVTPEYQSDFSYSNSSYTLGGGLMWKITDKLTFDLGVSNTFYEDDTVTFTDAYVGDYTEVYGKTTINFAAGLSYSIF